MEKLAQTENGDAAESDIDKHIFTQEEIEFDRGIEKIERIHGARKNELKNELDPEQADLKQLCPPLTKTAQ